MNGMSPCMFTNEACGAYARMPYFRARFAPQQFDITVLVVTTLRAPRRQHRSAWREVVSSFPPCYTMPAGEVSCGVHAGTALRSQWCRSQTAAASAGAYGEEARDAAR